MPRLLNSFSSQPMPSPRIQPLVAEIVEICRQARPQDGVSVERAGDVDPESDPIRPHRQCCHVEPAIKPPRRGGRRTRTIEADLLRQLARCQDARAGSSLSSRLGRPPSQSDPTQPIPLPWMDSRVAVAAVISLLPRAGEDRCVEQNRSLSLRRNRHAQIGVRGSGFGVRGSGFGVRGSGFGVRVWGSGFEQSVLPTGYLSVSLNPQPSTLNPIRSPRHTFTGNSQPSPRKVNRGKRMLRAQRACDQRAAGRCGCRSAHARSDA